MCGIVGAVAQRDVADILLEGLRRLEYRGYDSAGVAIINDNGELHRERRTGKVSELAEAVSLNPLRGGTGIAHTRWATHGAPSERNAHPHVSEDHIAVVHNGIIENHEALRVFLQGEGYVFTSDTDTEVIAHLVSLELKGSDSLLDAVQKAVARLEGAYGMVVMDCNDNERLVVARSGSPLVIGVGIGEHFIASDQLALFPVTRRFMFLEEGDVAEVTRNGVTILDAAGNSVERDARDSDIEHDAGDKGPYRHYMLKEIHEQPEAIANTLEGRLGEHQLNLDILGKEGQEILNKTRAVQIVACGTSYHAGMVARYWFEELAGIPCRVEIASEFRYRKFFVPEDCLFVTISQSGETADTLAALKLAKELGYMASLSIGNIFGNGGTSTGGCTTPNGHRSHQRTVAADKSAIANHRPEFIDTVVIAGNGASTNIHLIANFSVAHIAEVIDLAAFANHGFLDFHKVADPGFFLKFGAWPQSGKRANLTPGSDNRIFKNGVCLDNGTFPDNRVANHTTGFDINVIRQLNLAFENHIDVQGNVMASLDVATNIQTMWVNDRDTIHHQVIGQLLLPGTFQLHQLDTTVNTFHFNWELRLNVNDRGIFGHGHRDNIGEIELMLGIFIFQAINPATDLIAGNGHDARIHFIDGQLLRAGVLILNNGLNIAKTIADNPAITGRVGQVNGQQAEALTVTGRQQRLQGRGVNQGNVAIEHQHHIGTFAARQCLLHSMAGTQLLFLYHPVKIVVAQCLFYLLCAVTNHHMNLAVTDFSLRVQGTEDHMLQHGLASDTMQHLWQFGFHAAALPGSKNNDISSHGSLGRQSAPTGASAL